MGLSVYRPATQPRPWYAGLRSRFVFIGLYLRLNWIVRPWGPDAVSWRYWLISLTLAAPIWPYGWIRRVQAWQAARRTA